jgi:Tubulin-tyrosine ligase family
MLGFDLLIDQSGKPWLVEVNHSPSLSCDTPIDNSLKTKLLADTMRLASFSAAEEELLSIIKNHHPPSRAMSGSSGSQVSAALGATSALSTPESHPSAGSLESAHYRALTSAGSSESVDYSGSGGRAYARRHQARALLSQLITLRSEYESANRGEFELIFPSPHASLQTQYEKLLEASRRAYIEDTHEDFGSKAAGLGHWASRELFTASRELFTASRESSERMPLHSESSSQRESSERMPRPLVGEDVGRLSSCAPPNGSLSFCAPSASNGNLACEQTERDRRAATAPNGADGAEDDESDSEGTDEGGEEEHADGAGSGAARLLGRSDPAARFARKLLKKAQRRRKKRRKKRKG